MKILGLTIILYLLFFWLRWQQGGWEIQTEVFKSQRQFLDQQISQLLPSPQAELLSGILLGQNKTLPGDIKIALRDTSTLHIVVASGQNLTMVAGFFLLFSGLIKKKIAMILSLIAVVLYVLLSGAQVPVLRAAIMFVAGSTAQWIGREKDSPWILITTAGLMLLINPSWIQSISFQLSFLATAGVIVVAPIILRHLKLLPGFLATDLAVTLAAQIMVMPVIIQNFHQLSIVSVATNLLVLWTIPFIMIGGTLMLAVSLIWSIGGQLVAWCLQALLEYFVYIVQFFGSLPFAWEYIGELSIFFWIGYYCLVAASLKLLYDFRKK